MDYHTPREHLNWSVRAGNLGIVRLDEIPPNATFADIQKHAYDVEFLACR